MLHYLKEWEFYEHTGGWRAFNETMSWHLGSFAMPLQMKHGEKKTFVQLQNLSQE